MKVFDSVVKEKWSRRLRFGIWAGGKGRGIELHLIGVDWISHFSMGLEESLA